MPNQKYEVLFWGYCPKSGKRQFMVHEDKLFVSLSSDDSLHILTRVVQDAFWGETTSGLCYGAFFANPRNEACGYVSCQVDISRAKESRDDVGFHSMSSLKTISGLASFDRVVNLDLWAGIAFIEARQKEHM